MEAVILGLNAIVKGLLMGFKIKLFGGLALLCAVSAGCAELDVFPKIEFGSTWVSKEGKSQADLYKDQRECNHEVMMLRTPAFPGQMSGGAEELRVFEGCMRSRGWVKE